MTKTADFDPNLTKAFLNRFLFKRKLPAHDLLTVSELALRLRCTIKEIYSLTRRRRMNRGLLPLPHRKVGRKLLFVWREVETWLDKQPGVKGESK
jgi:hypothetical protein